MNRISGADIAQHFQLRKSGTEWVGPCPLCGGTDRFHVRDRPNKPLLGCRGCIDGQPPPIKRERFVQILDMVRDSPPQPPQHHYRTLRIEERAKVNEARIAAAVMLKQATPDTHPYLARKGFPKTRWLVHRGLMLVPVRSNTGRFLTVQTINHAGRKLFPKWSRVGGGRYNLGVGTQAWVCEGIASALSVYAALGVAGIPGRVTVAFSAHNIPKVARPGKDIVIADHDRADPHGRRAGQKYAERSGCVWWQPPVEGQDANDYHQQEGIHALAKALSSIL